MPEEPNRSLKDILGLKDTMSAYYLRAPQEYWQALGIKQAPYDDNTGEYDFIHAFFTSKIELSNMADILLSKLSHKGMLWISSPKLSANSDITTDITDKDIRDIFLPLGLKDSTTCSITDHWTALKLTWHE